ncbi:hypothetical protein MRV_0126 [Murid herpesvirus 3]|uniref:Uncharacterized protein n=2 Tax=Murid betaherpesvirus 3 TaxID=2560603 RepID=A0A1P8VJ29_9BETA|nr:hypothetical protein MRV_0126 [Murine roseolovirus]APZ76337.1 hypothetical protein MRV_0126 [Murid betaherpesvirus 3]AYH64796.1 hypothetical protein MRV_0126 [Murid herpesvirus 3]
MQPQVGQPHVPEFGETAGQVRPVARPLPHANQGARLRQQDPCRRGAFAQGQRAAHQGGQRHRRPPLHAPVAAQVPLQRAVEPGVAVAHLVRARELESEDGPSVARHLAAQVQVRRRLNHVVDRHLPRGQGRLVRHTVPRVPHWTAQPRAQARVPQRGEL